MAPIGTIASTLIACFFFLSVSFPPHAEALIDCKSLKNDIMTCLPYLHGKAAKPPITCCSVMQALNKVMDTQENRMKACECIREAAGTSPAFRTDRLNRLKEICEEQIPTEVFINSSCTKVK
ncbi:hypothetical protein H6P81_017267 [Aristolochia fimbriata]|uniref:Bifunctional inhibitor/plant lipid transfer protein/seed storage helical domain-containing protein n=1 Tax=Aristolochia fimbriata TaxID=158543 RepID=A0AAV7DXV3_ARIFI|nr:hypothetical protein H6P81_017267 [Aristolochia fimbriata]